MLSELRQAASRHVPSELPYVCDKEFLMLTSHALGDNHLRKIKRSRYQLVHRSARQKDLALYIRAKTAMQF